MLLVGFSAAGFQAPAAASRASRLGAISAFSAPDTSSLEVATNKAARQVASYRNSMEMEVERLREQLASTSKEVEEVATSYGQKLPDDWAAPLQMATKKTMRQVATFAASMEAEVESLGEQLVVAEDGAKLLVEELKVETRKKNMHWDKAKTFYKEAADAKAELALVKAELEALKSSQ